jgi:hypothetical protein
MTGSPGLRRFVRPDQGAGPAAPAFPESPAPAAPAGPESAAGSLPEPLAARLSQPIPPAAANGAGPAVGVGSSMPGTGAMPGARDTEKCELCAAEVPAEHGHVADLESSTLICACRACYLLFTQAAAGRGRYRAVPDRYLADPGRTLTPAQWDQLEVPVGLAFFLRSSSGDGVTGFYPSPAGVTECILDLAAWERLTQEYPLLGAPAPDVEAALICRTDAGVEYFLVPIDACYELAGRMRLYWRGFDGGAEAKASIAEFLDRARSSARPFSSEAERPEAERPEAGWPVAGRSVVEREA